MVTPSDFKASLADAGPSSAVSPPLTAMWRAAKGNWDEAHKIVQDEQDADAAWVHAYLHRKEGDFGNAGFWYRQAGRPVQTGDLKIEWEEIVGQMLGR